MVGLGPYMVVHGQSISVPYAIVVFCLSMFNINNYVILNANRQVHSRLLLMDVSFEILLCVQIFFNSKDSSGFDF